MDSDTDEIVILPTPPKPKPCVINLDDEDDDNRMSTQSEYEIDLNKPSFTDVSRPNHNIRTLHLSHVDLINSSNDKVTSTINLAENAKALQSQTESYCDKISSSSINIFDSSLILSPQKNSMPSSEMNVSSALIAEKDCIVSKKRKNYMKDSHKSKKIKSKKKKKKDSSKNKKFKKSSSMNKMVKQNKRVPSTIPVINCDSQVTRSVSPPLSPIAETGIITVNTVADLKEKQNDCGTEMDIEAEFLNRKITSKQSKKQSYSPKNIVENKHNSKSNDSSDVILSYFKKNYKTHKKFLKSRSTCSIINNDIKATLQRTSDINHDIYDLKSLMCAEFSRFELEKAKSKKHLNADTENQVTCAQNKGNKIDDTTLAITSFASNETNLDSKLGSTDLLNELLSFVNDEKSHLSSADENSTVTEDRVPSKELALLVEKHKKVIFKQDIVNINLSNARSKIDMHRTQLKKWENCEKQLTIENDELDKQKSLLESLIKNVLIRNFTGLQNQSMPWDTIQPVNDAMLNEEDKSYVEKSTDISETIPAAPVIPQLTTKRPHTLNGSNLISSAPMGSKYEATNSDSIFPPTEVKLIVENIISDVSKDNLAVTEDIKVNSKSSLLPDKPELECSRDAESSEDNNEITISRSPQIAPLVITIDDEEEKSTYVENDSFVKSGSKIDNKENFTGSSQESKRFKGSNNVFNGKKFQAHREQINAIVVFEDYLYTSSNDYSAKRFCLQDINQVVVYEHEGKNIKEIVVERILLKVVVCTTDSSDAISMYDAETGTRIAKLNQHCGIVNICKGWGKMYSGLIDGSISIYRWKPKSSLPLVTSIDTKIPISHMATTHEGQTPYLVILCSNGHLYLRHARTGLLVQCIQVKVSTPTCLAVHKNLVIFRNSEESVAIFNSMTKQIEKIVKVSQFVNGFTANENYIFSIVAHGGWVNCHEVDSAEPDSNCTIFYGAGKRTLTCVYLYKKWVFTGNHKGNVYGFKFNPNSSEICMYRHCHSKFWTKGDLEFHVKNHHLPQEKDLNCQWTKCKFRYQETDEIEVKTIHIKTHIRLNQ